MAIKDNKSSTNVVVLFNTNQTGDGTVNSPGLDTADYDNGVTFLPILVTAAGASTVAVTAIQDSDDDGGSDPYADVSSNQLIGDLTDFTTLSAVTDGDVIKTLGVIGNKRYVRAVLEFQGTTTDADFILGVNAGVEVAPGDS